MPPAFKFEIYPKQIHYEQQWPKPVVISCPREMDGATWLPAPREKSRARAEIADASYLIVAERPLQICRVPAGEKFRIGAQVTYTGPLTGFPADIDVELLRSMADIYATKIGFVPLTQKLDSEYSKDEWEIINHITEVGLYHSPPPANFYPDSSYPNPYAGQTGFFNSSPYAHMGS